MGVSGDEAAELMRLHRDQVRMYDEVPTEPPGGVSGRDLWEDEQLGVTVSGVETIVDEVLGIIAAQKSAATNRDLVRPESPRSVSPTRG